MSFVGYVVSQWAQFFGSPGILALVLIAVITVILLASRAGKSVIAIVLLPLILTFGANATSKVGVAHWISISVWLAVGFVLFGFWAALLR